MFTLRTNRHANTRAPTYSNMLVPHLLQTVIKKPICNLACQRESSTLTHLFPPHTGANAGFSMWLDYDLDLRRCRKTPGGEARVTQHDQPCTSHQIIIWCVCLSPSFSRPTNSAGVCLQTQLVRKYLQPSSKFPPVLSDYLLRSFLNYCCCPNCVKCHSCFQG